MVSKDTKDSPGGAMCWVGVMWVRNRLTARYSLEYGSYPRFMGMLHSYPRSMGELYIWKITDNQLQCENRGNARSIQLVSYDSSTVLQAVL